MGRAFGKALIVPLIVLGVFLAAPHWLNSNIREGITQSMRARGALTPQAAARLEQMDFVAICLHPKPDELRIRADLERSGIVGQANRLHFSLLAAWLLLGILLISFTAIILLNRAGTRSAETFLRSYRLGWGWVTFAALAQLFVLTPLLAYGCFETTVLLSHRYYPKLILFIVLGGGLGLIRGVQVLLQKIPMEFSESMARQVTPEEAPELWAATREAAARLGTAPPDSIVVGMQLNFYVTELAVRHSTGRATGRTLYLSYPCLKQLTGAEVLAIIGHELGHFIGEDTRMTREFYPFRRKVHGTMVALAQATFVGWTSLQLLNFFGWCFGLTERTLSRQRELVADQWAARLAGAPVAARALVKFHVLVAAFQHGMGKIDRKAGQNPLETPLRAYIAENLPVAAPFWGQLFEKSLPHPLDTHPPLRERLVSLGEEYSAAAAREAATGEAPSAFTDWLAGRDELFAPLRQQTEAVVDHVRRQEEVRELDYQTPEGRATLDQLFPPVRWESRPGHLWFIEILCGIIAGGFLLVAVVVNQPFGWGLGVVVAALGAWGATSTWQRHRRKSCTLSAGGLHHTGWTGPVNFADVAGLKFVNSHGSWTLVLRFKAARGPVWKSSLWRLPRREAKLPLTTLIGKHQPMAQAIHDYFTRQLKPPANVPAEEDEGE